MNDNYAWKNQHAAQEHSLMMNVDKNLDLISIDKGDECYSNGIFVFVITKKLLPQKYVPEHFELRDHI